MEANGWIPKHAIRSKIPSLGAVFVGSVGKNEAKWRSFWAWHDSTDIEDQHTNNNSIAPESSSQSSCSGSPPNVGHTRHNVDHVCIYIYINNYKTFAI